MQANILIVDDEELILWSLGETLSKEGYNIDLAENGAVAIEKINKSKYDVVITDVKMPGVSGEEVINHIFEKSPSSKVIVITATRSIELYNKMKKTCEVQILEKPFEMSELFKAIES